jgi:hypothetical protein
VFNARFRFLQKHARYLKQLAGGTARLLIDSDGEDLTEEAETHAERHARMVEAAAAKVASIEGAEKASIPELCRRNPSLGFPFLNAVHRFCAHGGTRSFVAGRTQRGRNRTLCAVYN